MKGGKYVLVALGLAMVLSLPLIGMALSTPKADVYAHALSRGPLKVTLLPPLAMRTEWYGGAVIPIRVSVTDHDEPNGTSGANVTVWVNGVAAASSGAVNMGNVMKEMGGGLYQFNLNTKPYPAGPGSEPIPIKVLATKATEDRNGGFDIEIHLN